MTRPVGALVRHSVGGEQIRVGSVTLIDDLPATSLSNLVPTITVTPGPSGSLSWTWAFGPSRLTTSRTAGFWRLVRPDLGVVHGGALGCVADLARAEALVLERRHRALREAEPFAGVVDADRHLGGRDPVAALQGRRHAHLGLRAVGERRRHGRPAPGDPDEQQDGEHPEGEEGLEVGVHARRAVGAHLLPHLVDAGVEHVPLVQGRAQGAMEAVLEVQIAVPSDDVGEQVAVEGGVLVEEGVEPQRVLGRDQLVEADLARWQRRPLAGGQVVGWVRPTVPHPLEDHAAESTDGVRGAG